MLTSIDRYVRRACTSNRFETRQQVLSFAILLTFVVTLAADLLNLAAHYILHVLGLLPYAVIPAATVGLIISTLTASSLTFSVVYVVGMAIHHLTISSATFERLSRTDMLSGLLNRRAFLDEVARAPENASLVLFDIDKFKAINDRYGHDVGDQVIVAVSKQLEAVFGHQHVIARIGGEEFAVLVIAMTASDRLALAERCRELIAAQPVALQASHVPVTVSGGVADREDHGTFEALFSACDKALYLAKASGRNCVLHSNDLSTLLGTRKTIAG